MCGIFGVSNRLGLDTNALEQFRLMSLQMLHRGPDGSGEFINSNIAIGMNRLSIIDSTLSMQPIYNRERNVFIFANCEIYNYIELRKNLEDRGSQFLTNGDAETILQAYLQFDLGFTENLRGMFAFAIIDLRMNRLILGRDRMGEKPLYFVDSPSNFWFSSELSPLIRSRVVLPKINKEAIPQYLLHGFVPEPLSIINGVQKVAAGTLLIKNFLETGTEILEYWNINDATSSLESDPHRELKCILDEIAKMAVRSDVPLGVALSSGVDSTIITNLARKYHDNVQTFTVGYEGNFKCDESELAIEFANAIGLKSHRIEITSKEVGDRFQEVCEFMDEPVADISAFSYLKLAEAANLEGVKVLMTGQGADELFWGYSWVREAAFKSSRRALSILFPFKYRNYLHLKLPGKSLKGLLKGVIDGFGMPDNFSSLLLDRRAKNAENHGVSLYENRPSVRKIYKIIAGISATSSPRFENHEILFNNISDIEPAIIELIAGSYLKSNGLAQIDRLMMSASVEARTPFVDYRIVEFAMREAGKANSFNSPPKAALLNAANEYYPEHFLKREKKGFTPPVKDWYKAIYRANMSSFADPRIVSLGLVKDSCKKRLVRPLTIFGRPRTLWLEFAVLEMWVRGIETMSGQRMASQ